MRTTRRPESLRFKCAQSLPIKLNVEFLIIKIIGGTIIEPSRWRKQYFVFRGTLWLIGQRVASINRWWIIVSQKTELRAVYIYIYDCELHHDPDTDVSKLSCVEGHTLSHVWSNKVTQWIGLLLFIITHLGALKGIVCVFFEVGSYKVWPQMVGLFPTVITEQRSLSLEKQRAAPAQTLSFKLENFSLISQSTVLVTLDVNGDTHLYATYRCLKMVAKWSATLVKQLDRIIQFTISTLKKTLA